MTVIKSTPRILTAEILKGRSNLSMRPPFSLIILRRGVRTSEPDIMDSFTTSLVDVKSQKWYKIFTKYLQNINKYFEVGY